MFFAAICPRDASAVAVKPRALMKVEGAVGSGREDILKLVGNGEGNVAPTSQGHDCLNGMRLEKGTGTVVRTSGETKWTAQRTAGLARAM
jgi:hypothetical protein